RGAAGLAGGHLGRQVVRGSAAERSGVRQDAGGADWRTDLRDRRRPGPRPDPGAAPAPLTPARLRDRASPRRGRRAEAPWPAVAGSARHGYTAPERTAGSAAAGLGASEGRRGRSAGIAGPERK